MEEVHNPFADDGVAMEDISNGERELPPIVPNSVLQLDGDFSSYYLAWTDETLAQNCDALKRHIEIKRLMAGMETVNVHTTRGDKSGRPAIAQVKEYQGKRTSDDPAKEARVKEIRQFLETYSSTHVVPMPQWEMEADDSMSIEQLKMAREGRMSKIMTKDKDLNMVDGAHIHYDTYEEWTNYGYGKIWLDRSGSQVKCTGQGKAFFWAQMLMGDSTDSIPGLPKLPAEILNVIQPTKAIISAQKTLANPKATPRARAAAQKAIAARKSKNIGHTLAYEVLKDCTDDFEAMRRVRSAYTKYYGAGTFKFETWRGSVVETNAGLMLLEQAQLLWMLRSEGDNVLDYIREISK